MNQNNFSSVIDINEADLDMIGLMRNNWRQRLVEIYQHPDSDNMVVTIGYPLDSVCSIQHNQRPIITIEEKDSFQHAIRYFMKTGMPFIFN